MSEGDDYTLDVTVHIWPLWIRPIEPTATESGAAQRMAREQAESRYAMLGYEIAYWLRERLSQMDEAERAEAVMRLLRDGL